jgi:hypothetical protein
VEKETRYILTLGRRDISWFHETRYIAINIQEDEMTSNSSRETHITSNAVLRAWVRAPFGTRSETSTPTRPRVSHGHELPRRQLPPLV